MALTGSIRTNNYDGRYYTLSWSATQSVANNNSVISWTIACAGGDDSWYAERTLKAVINGTTVYSKTDRVERKAGTIRTGTITIPHNTDGSKSFSCSLQVACYTNAVNLTKSGSFTLNTIPRGASITAAPNFNDEGNPKITYNNPAGNAVDSLKVCISFDGSKDDIAYRDVSKTGSSYTFNLTTAERNILRNGTTTANSRAVYFYIQTEIGGNTFRNRVEKTLSIINANPTLNPTAIDVGSVSKTLTGDAANKVIKYYNAIEVAANATALKGATIKNYKISNGGKSISTASGKLNSVEGGDFTFTATDSRGNTTTKTLKKTLINYVKLTCNLSVAAPTTDGKLTLTVSGNYFNGSFGAVANALTVQYRYKSNSGSYGSWTAATATLNGNKYTATINLTGLDYRSSYTFEARAGDKIYNGDTEPFILSASKTVKTTPIFDWGAEDFMFNVPVGLNWNGYSYDLLGLFRAMTTTYTPECDVSPGENYSSATITAHLTGCNLRIGLSATRKETLNAGNFSNETVATVDINHGGKLANLYRVSFNTSTSGGVATLDCQATKVNDNVVRLTINLCAAAQSLTEFNAYFAMPCTIITKAYV